MKPLVEYPDPEAAIVTYFATAYTGNIADRKPANIKTSAPQAPLAADTDWLQVEHDGSPEVVGYVEQATVRVNYHTPPGKRSDAKRGAALAWGLLAQHPGDESVHNTVALVGRQQPVVDPATKNVMVWFTFRVNLRAIPVSV